MFRSKVFIVLFLTLILTLPARAGAVEFSMGGAMRIIANVAGEFDGRNEWSGSQVKNARAGIYTPDDVYDRGSHFFASGPGTEDNPSNAAYVGFTNSLTPYGGAAADYAGVGYAPPAVTNGVGTNTAWGPVLNYVAGQNGQGMRNNQDLGDDEVVNLDQRMELEFTVKPADCLQVVTLWRIDGTWGQPNGGADWGADDIAVSVLNAYLDFYIPDTPVSGIAGVYSFDFHRGWLVTMEAAGAILSATYDPAMVELIYIRAMEGGAFEDRNDDVDIYGVSASYGHDEIFATASFFYQDGPASSFTSADPNKAGAMESFGNTVHWYCLDLDWATEDLSLFFTGIMNGGSNEYYRLDDRTATGVANPAATMKPVEADYNGFLLNAGAELTVSNLTLGLEGLYISGDEFKDFTPGIAHSQRNFFRYQDSDDEIDRYVYMGIGIGEGADAHYSEIIGLGLFEQAAAGTGAYGQWMGGGNPYNLWFLKLSGDYKITDVTVLKTAYYYFRTAEDVVSSIAESSPATYGQVVAEDSAIGHEINIVLEQNLCDNLILSVVGAYLFADDAYSIYSDDEDAYEYGLRLFVYF